MPCVGSGSPTALARTVTLGLRDFVRLPYQGIWRGPRGFLAGIVNGSASLVSHVTAGTVTSVTQLANSVARNVDRLSCDSDFQQRSEEGTPATATLPSSSCFLFVFLFVDEYRLLARFCDDCVV